MEDNVQTVCHKVAEEIAKFLLQNGGRQDRRDTGVRGIVDGHELGSAWGYLEVYTPETNWGGDRSDKLRGKLSELLYAQLHRVVGKEFFKRYRIVIKIKDGPSPFTTLVTAETPPVKVSFEVSEERIHERQRA